MNELTVAQVMEAIDAAQERLGVDLLHVGLFGDGSGHVMAPMRDWSDDGKRTDPLGEEEVHEFQNPDELMTWLREGKLPEQQDQVATPNAMTCEDFYEGTPA